MWRLEMGFHASVLFKGMLHWRGVWIETYLDFARHASEVPDLLQN
jgi:hypothetical protein